VSDRRACLGSERFEEILIMKSAWGGNLVDWAALNSSEVEEIDLVEYEELLDADEKVMDWDLESESEPDIN